MNTLTVVSGTIVETQRFINVPLRMLERYLARERREVWLREADGQERKWIIYCRVLPGRRGHRVVLLLWGDWVSGVAGSATAGAAEEPVARDSPSTTGSSMSKKEHNHDRGTGSGLSAQSAYPMGV